MQVFIVDDSEIILNRVKILLFAFEELEFIGHTFNADGAVETILKLKPDVVILDIRLKGGNGIKILECIKKEEPSILVIMLTNYPYPHYREKCRKLKAEYIFDKVTEIESFVKVLKALAQDSAQEKNRRRRVCKTIGRSQVGISPLYKRGMHKEVSEKFAGK